MPRLRFSDDARHDLKDINRYIAQDKPVAARKWVEKIKEKCCLLASHPELGEFRKDFGQDVRCTFVGRYVIYFRRKGPYLEISRVIPGDRDIQSL